MNPKIKLSKRMQKIAVLFTMAILFFPIASCAQKTHFLVSTVAPAAKGTLRVKKDSNKNYRIKISIMNLAEPSRLTPSKSAYVVWMIAEDNTPKNIGQIKTSTSLLSNTLKASFETVSAEKPIKLFITAEDDPSIQYNYSEIILTSKNL